MVEAAGTGRGNGVGAGGAAAQATRLPKIAPFHIQPHRHPAPRLHGAAIPANVAIPANAAVRANVAMWLILIEALGAGLILVVIVWWTMFSGRKGGERRDPGDRD